MKYEEDALLKIPLFQEPIITCNHVQEAIDHKFFLLEEASKGNTEAMVDLEKDHLERFHKDSGGQYRFNRKKFLDYCKKDGIEVVFMERERLFMFRPDFSSDEWKNNADRVRRNCRDLHAKILKTYT